MNTYADRTKNDEKKPGIGKLSGNQTGGEISARFIDRRPESILQKKQLETIQPQKSEAHSTLTNNKVIQRLVLLIDEDSMTAGSYRHLTSIDPETDPTGSLRSINEDLDGLPLEQLGLNETLHVIVHGGGGETSIGDAGALLDYLMERGLRSYVHRGAIRLISCFSGTPSPTGTFAQKFATELRTRGFTNAVIGFDGLVQVRDGASVYVVPPGKSREFFLRSQRKDRQKREFEELSARKPAKNAPQEDVDFILLEVEMWKTGFDDNIQKLSNLWEPQSIGKNIVYIAEAKEYIGDMLRPDVYSRQQDQKRFDDWYSSILAGYHHDTEVGTSQGTPTYIS
jgi:hypothetical protein